MKVFDDIILALRLPNPKYCNKKLVMKTAKLGKMTQILWKDSLNEVIFRHIYIEVYRKNDMETLSTTFK